jgi:hypothetical protein
MVWQRALGRCEYCLLHEEDTLLPHEPDHIIAWKHRGLTILENLACACYDCNRFKGTDVASFDLVTRRIVRLFHPRTDRWDRHFQLDVGRIIPMTAVGRVTEFLLQLNLLDRVRTRRRLMRSGHYPR